LDKPEVVIVCGPTASGKSALAMELAAELNGEIVSVDSVQIYRTMNIGTAKPSSAELQKVPHHIIDILNPDERMDAYRYANLAHRAIRDIVTRAKTPILVGGSGLHFSAIFNGFFESPPVDIHLRAKLQSEATESGSLIMHQRLASVDAESALRIHPNNVRRVLRSLEIFLQTGITQSEQFRLQSKNFPFSIRKSYYVVLPKGELHSRIEQRAEAMFRDGLIEEVAGVIASFGEDASALSAIGYAEVREYLLGRYSRSEAIANVKQHTRALAKRQCTWFDKHYPLLVKAHSA